MKDQLRDYQYRGMDLEELSFFDFVVNTYDKAERPTEIDDNAPPTSATQKAGRPRNMRIPYLPEGGKPNSCRVLRTNGHETIPRFSGPWVASSNDENNREFYAASMLLLFKPWRSLKDLKQDEETFDKSWCGAEQMLSGRERRLVENFEFYHDCWAAATLKRDMERAGEEVSQFDFKPPEPWTGIDLEPQDEGDDDNDRDDPFWIPDHITEAMIQEARERQVAMRETIFAQGALQEAHEYGIFKTKNLTCKRGPIARIAHEDEIAIFGNLNEQLKTATRVQIERQGLIDIGSLGMSQNNTDPEILLLSEDNEELAATRGSAASSQIIIRPLLQLLNQDQLRAHNIVEAKLRAHLDGMS